jgi:hypothetical protein
MVRSRDSILRFRYERVLRSWLQHHIGATPRLIVYQMPLVILADMIHGEEDIAGLQHNGLAVRVGRTAIRSTRSAKQKVVVSFEHTLLQSQNRMDCGALFRFGVDRVGDALFIWLRGRVAAGH